MVAKVRTPITTRDFTRALVAAWPQVTKAQAGVLWAQWAFETGRGAHCYNFNLGNAKATRSQVAAGVPYFSLPGTWEIINGKREVFSDPDDPQTWFRAFGSLEEGMAHHLGLLRARFALAWDAVESGKPATFAHALKARGYFTGDLGDYERGMVSLHAEFMRSEAEVDPRPEPDMGGPVHGSHVVDGALGDVAGREPIA